MGNFYMNLMFKGVSVTKVRNALEEHGQQAYVAAVAEDIAIAYIPEDDLMQNPMVIEELSADFSRKFNCVAWSIANADDDMLWYELYINGEQVDEYNSSPDESQSGMPEGGDAGKLAQAFGIESAEKTISTVLRKPNSQDDGYIFAVDRHGDIAKALGLPIDLMALGYTYLELGETNDIDPESFVHTAM